MRTRRLLLVIALLLIPTTAFAAEYKSGDSVTVTDSSPGDLYVAGNTVKVSAAAPGESFLAGKDVTSETAPARSLFIAGQKVTATGGSGYNLFAAGSDVTISGTVENDVRAFGSNVTIDKDAVIKGDVAIFASTVTIAGTINGNVYLAAGTATSSATIGGNLTGETRVLKFEGGSVAGNINYSSDTDYTGSVDLKGSAIRTPLPTPNPLDRIINALKAVLAALALGALLVWRFRPQLNRAVDELQARYGLAFLAGILGLFISPIVAIALIATGIGWKIGLLIGLGYLAALLVMGVIAALFIGRFILERTAQQASDNSWDALLTGVVTITLLSALPYVGSLFMVLFILLAFIPAFGSLVLRGLRRPTTV